MMIRRFAAFLAALMLITCACAWAEGGVAGESDMTDVIDIVPEGMTPVTGDMLKDGTYPVKVDVSSAMFKVNGADITVSGGSLTARLYMNSEAYGYMFAGTAEDAVSADRTQWAALEENEDGTLTFTLPVDALNSGWVCAAFSVRKQLWYPRVILFRADTLPADAWKEEYLTTAESLSLEDGRYTCHAALNGPGKTALAETAYITVRDHQVTADIVFSTRKIDYVIVDGEKYLPTSTENGAAFTVPVMAFDLPLTVTVDSTAIKPAAEVTYTMTFDSSSLAAE